MKKTGFILLILASLLSINTANATHQNGGYITWSCIGQDSFLVTAILYGDCNGVNISPLAFTFKNQQTGATITTVNSSFQSTVDITPVCKTSCSRCQSLACSFPYGIKKYIAQGIVNLSSAGNACKILISWDGGSRSTSSTSNATNPYFESMMDRCQNPCDNAPVPNEMRYPILCLDQDYTLDFSVTDYDTGSNGSGLDSITYELTSPLESHGTGIQYSGQYSYQNPVYYLGFPNSATPLPYGFHLNSNTGTLQFRPHKAETSFMAVKINEFRNGNKTGEITHDILVIVFSCGSNPPPQLTTPNNIQTKSVFPGDTVIFEFSTNEPYSSDTLTISWNHAIPGATWTENNGQVKHPSATLKWVPTLAQSSWNEYKFTVTATDNHCPISSDVTKEYRIFVSPVPIIEISPIPKRCVNGAIISLNNYVTVNGKPTNKGIWFSPNSGGLIFGDKFNPVAAGVSSAPGWKVIFEYTDQVTGRSNKDSAYITIYALPNAYKLYDTVCTGKRIKLPVHPLMQQGNWRGTGVYGSNPDWYFNPDTSGIINGGKYELIYHFSDNNSCENEDTLWITVFRTLPADAGTDKEFCIDGISQTLTGLPAGGIWTGKGVSGNVFYPSIADVGVHDLKYSYTNVICSSTATVKYTVWGLPLVTASTQSGKTKFCRTDGLILLSGQPAGTGGVWSGPGVTGNNFNTFIGADVNTDYTLGYEYTDVHKCRNFASLKVTVIVEPEVVIDPSANKLCFGNPYNATASFNHADGIYWWKGAQSDGSIIGSPAWQSISYNPGLNDMSRLYFWLFVKTTHPANHVCSSAYDSIKALMSALPVTDFIANPIVGNPPLTVHFSDSSKVNPGKISIWVWDFGDGFMSGDKDPVHTYQNAGKYSVKLKAISDAGCENTLIKSDYIKTSNSVSTRINKEMFKFYPNPASSLLFVEFSGTGDAVFMLTDILGNTILEKKIIPGTNQINIQNTRPGVYFVFIEGMIAGKLLIE